MNDEENVIDDVEEIPETQEQEADTSPATEETPEQKLAFTAEQQAHLNHIAANKAYETREQKRRADGLQSQLNDLKAQQAPAAERPAIPAMPDAYEDNYEQQVALRDEAIKGAAIFDAQQQLNANNAAYRKQQAETEEQADLAKKSELYKKNAVAKGIDMAALGIAAGQIEQYGLDEDVVMEMLGDTAGPAITLYLASNPHLIDKLNDASSFSLGALYNEIKNKAVGKSKNIPNAPNPVDNFSGSGVPPKQRGPVGATFE